MCACELICSRFCDARPCKPRSEGDGAMHPMVCLWSPSPVKYTWRIEAMPPTTCADNASDHNSRIQRTDDHEERGNRQRVKDQLASTLPATLCTAAPRNLKRPFADLKKPTFRAVQWNCEQMDEICLFFSSNICFLGSCYNGEEPMSQRIVLRCHDSNRR